MLGRLGGDRPVESVSSAVSIRMSLERASHAKGDMGVRGDVAPTVGYVSPLESSN
ncbi:MAG: hypothetical protein ACYTEX_07620 [Planctomycetota bacterium]